MAELFDMSARELRRDRAARQGPVLFVYERVLQDILDRLADVRRDFRAALLIGVPDASAIDRLRTVAQDVQAIEPGAELARAAGAIHVREDEADFAPASFDLCIALGTLDTLDDTPGALERIRSWLEPDALLVGAIAGGNTLPKVRAAMREADIAAGAAAPHVHPRIEASSLGHLLTAAGFVMPVVDVDRIQVSYRSLGQLVQDLRGMGATNILKSRPPRLSRAAWEAARRSFGALGNGERSVETFEILHFAAWTPVQG